MVSPVTNGHSADIAHINLSYDSNNSGNSARELAYRIHPEWRQCPEDIEITKFTDGITNTLLRLSRRSAGLSQDEIDRDTVLMRAYGNNTEILIDRDREAVSHNSCAAKGLAPPLLARFDNGLLYRYVAGEQCTPYDFTQENVWRLVAARLGEWHARLPVLPTPKVQELNGVNGTNGTHHANGINGSNRTTDSCNGTAKSSSLQARCPSGNIWMVMQKWVQALPTSSQKQQKRKQILQQELLRCFKELDTNEGPGEQGMVFGHCDLLSGNVIKIKDKSNGEPSVAFIDYEYAVPCPATFDIANHFAEWAGYDCDYSLLPVRSIRRKFLQEYLASYNAHSNEPVAESMLTFLEREIDRYRGMPGFYWGVWALIQATISEIDFDYANYAELRLGEYFAWRAQEDGSIPLDGAEIPLRERRWAEP